jgi:hypothetical protein
MKSQKAPGRVPATSGSGDPGNTERPRSTGPTQEEIRVRAHEIYAERGRTDGRDLDDWLQG